MQHFGAELRSDYWMYVLRSLQFVGGLITLGLAGSEVSAWHGNDCTSPARLNYNVAIAALVLPALIYLLLTTGDSVKRFTSLPWSAWGQLAIDTLFMVFFLAAGALWAENFSCDNLCGLCAAFGYDDTYDGRYSFGSDCSCYAGSSYRRKLAIRASVSSSESAAGAKALGKVSKQAAKQGFDWLMFIFFLMTFAGTIYAIYQERRAARSSAPPVGDSEASEMRKEPDVSTHPVADDQPAFVG